MRATTLCTVQKRDTRDKHPQPKCALIWIPIDVLTLLRTRLVHLGFGLCCAPRHLLSIYAQSVDCVTYYCCILRSPIAGARDLTIDKAIGRQSVTSISMKIHAFCTYVRVHHIPHKYISYGYSNANKFATQIELDDDDGRLKSFGKNHPKRSFCLFSKSVRFGYQVRVTYPYKKTRVSSTMYAYCARLICKYFCITRININRIFESQTNFLVFL